ncbi:response regulator transcription factor [uncultured Sphingorhabdus sp.]|uniref:LuxR C-terminal-related transcriptional regulator n=1 Tax=uncultured Sphingorhabdus sp. TaxID=1686106 RepID=UPI0026087AC6|nr:response regulator transcription factor [uncultured Sphingorhabdus sp.]HMS20539.1 response regulator transcription factor [Sphingorhabdus sp.]
MQVFATISQNGVQDLIMLDLFFLGIDPRETLAAARQSCPKSLIVNVSMLDNQANIDKLFEQGADAYIVKSVPATEMLEALMAIKAGEFVIARKKASSEEDSPEQPEIKDLSKRQREILLLLREGYSNKEIGRKLALSPFTVRNHISLLMRVLRVHSRFELATKAASFGQ